MTGTCQRKGDPFKRQRPNQGAGGMPHRSRGTTHTCLQSLAPESEHANVFRSAQPEKGMLAAFSRVRCCTMGRGKMEQRGVMTRADTSSSLSLFSGVLLVTLWLAQILRYGLYICTAQNLCVEAPLL